MTDNIDAILGLTRPSEADKLAERLVRGDSKFIDDLIAQRHKSGMTQAGVAEALGLTQSAIAKFESAERDPRLSTIRRYALAVGAIVRHDVRPAGEDPTALSFHTVMTVAQPAPRATWRPGAAEMTAFSLVPGAASGSAS